jgi:hypothetical protein
MAIIAFVDRRPEDRELRAHATGLIRIASFLCVNTGVLKRLVRRCKSSIKNGLQQLGYTSIKVKTTGNSALATELTALFQCLPSNRQWTVRACGNAQPFEQASVGGQIAHPLPIPILDATMPALSIPPLEGTIDQEAIQDPFEDKIGLENTPSFFFDDVDGGRFSDVGLFK